MASFNQNFNRPSFGKIHELNNGEAPDEEPDDEEEYEDEVEEDETQPSKSPTGEVSQNTTKPTQDHLAARGEGADLLVAESAKFETEKTKIEKAISMLYKHETISKTSLTAENDSKRPRMIVIVKRTQTVPGGIYEAVVKGLKARVEMMKKLSS